MFPKLARSKHERKTGEYSQETLDGMINGDLVHAQ
jgi:hypothetical protein